MRLNRPPRRTPQDPTIALINIVFLMLIFFLLAGTIAAGTDGDIALIRTSEAERSPPPAQAVSITSAGEILYGGETVETPDLIARLSQTASAPIVPAEPLEEGSEPETGKPVSVVADQKLPATDLIAFLRELKSAGYAARIVTRSGGTL